MWNSTREKHTHYWVKCVKPLVSSRGCKGFEDIFQGMEKLSAEYRIELKEPNRPTILTPRKAPLTLRQRLREELDRLIDLGITEQVEELTEWV